MKQIRRVVCILLCAIMMQPYIIFANATTAIVSEDETISNDEKIYCEATIDQNFSDNSVLVVLDSKMGAINKNHHKSLFGTIGITNIVDLTEIPNYETDKNFNEMLSQIDETNFRQILRLDLAENSKENVLRVIRELEKMDGVLYAGPNYRCVSLEATTSPSVSFGDQWGLRQIGITEAWDITTGSSNVRVGVIDTGIANHVDLNDNVDTEKGFDFTGENTTARDDLDGHGTVVAGIIGAIGDNTAGVSGISWNVTLVPLQVWSQTEGSDIAWMISAISYAMNENIPILNISMSSESYSTALLQAIGNYPGLVVCAAGNQGNNIDEHPRYPAAFDCPNLITVANSDSSDQLYEGEVGPSNYSKNKVHLAAPGTAIQSTYLNGTYAPATGTSFAAPHVAGVAALIYSIRPDLTAVEVKNLILNNVDKDETNLGDKCITGGRLNAYKAVRAATEPQTFTGDVNGDGRSDMILSRKVNGKRAITTYLGQSDGSFGNPITTQSTRSFVYTDPAFAGDFNGDGLTDIVVHWSSNYKRQLLVYTSKGNGQFNEGVNLSSTRFHDSNQVPCSLFVEDVNGDGCDDFIVHYRNTSGKRCALVYKGKTTAPYFYDATTDALVSTNTYYHQDPVYMGDFNGDGYADMLVHWVGEYSARQLLLYTGKSDGTFNSGVNFSSIMQHTPGELPSRFFITDQNGDGKDDFIMHYKNYDGYRGTLVYKGKAPSPHFVDTMQNALTSTNSYVDSDPVFVGDINGDGRADMIVHWTLNGYRQLLIYIAKADGTYNAAIRQATSNSHDPINAAGSFYVADVNGDGRDDFIVKWRSGLNIRFLTYLGTASGSFTAAVRTYPQPEVPYYNET